MTEKLLNESFVDDQSIDVEQVIDDRESKTAYVFDKKTLCFFGTVSADPDQMDLENWIKPFNSSFDEPPQVEENQAVVRDVESNEWIVKADFRGSEYWDEDGTKHTITEVGEEIPEGALLEEPIILPTDTELAATARAKRDALLNAISWRYERNAREARLGIETTDSIEALDAYTQALADVPQQEGFPIKVEWPAVPA